MNSTQHFSFPRSCSLIFKVFFVVVVNTSRFDAISDRKSCSNVLLKNMSCVAIIKLSLSVEKFPDLFKTSLLSFNSKISRIQPLWFGYKPKLRKGRLPHCRQIPYCLRHQGRPIFTHIKRLPRWLSIKNLSANARDVGDSSSNPGLGRSSGGRNGNLQYSCLENLMDRGTWWAIIYGITNSRTQLSIHTHESNTIIKQKKEHFLTTLYTAGIVTDFMHGVQSLSRVRLFAAPWTATHQASLSFTIFQEFAQIHVHCVSDTI